jgi:hypothetical protein
MAASNRVPPTAALRLLRQRGGNVSMIFALMVIPMLGAIGLAVDFGQALTARNKAQVAADAAVLQASGVARDLIQKGDGSNASTASALSEAKGRAEQLFGAYAAQTALRNYTFTATVTRNGQAIEATGDFSIRTNNWLGPLFGQNSYNSVGSVKSSASLPSYIDVYLAMDVSQSMGLGATQADMLALFGKVGCVFGCHVQEHGHAASNSAVAKANNIDLRIDVLRRAVQKMIATAEKDAGQSATYRFGLYTMGANPANIDAPYLGELTAINGDFAVLDQKAEGIELGPNDTRGQGDSYFRQPLQALAPIVPAAGDGSSRSKARTFLFIVTDGLRDVANSSGVSCASGSYGNHCMGVMDPTLCQAFKDKNVTVGVLYTTFLPIYANPGNPNDRRLEGNYVNLVVNNGLAPQIAPKLQACATSGWFYEAADAAGIDKAMSDMFEQITVTPMLVQ